MIGSRVFSYNTRVLTLFLWAINFYSALAGNIYFSTSSGDDSRSYVQAKDPQTPWQTLDKLNEVFGSLQPGDTVFLKRDDVFEGAIQVRASGISGLPIVISAYGEGSNPVVSGWRPIETWEYVGGGIYKASLALTSKTSILTINGIPQEMGRFPNEGYFQYNVYDKEGVIQSQVPLGDKDYSNAMLVLRKNQWVIDSHSLLSVEGDEIHFMGDGHAAPTDNYGFFVQDHLTTLDQFGEWYHDTHTDELYLFLGESDPVDFKIRVSSEKNLMTNTAGTGFVIVDNICFSGANGTAVLLVQGEAFGLHNCTIEFSGENALTALSVPYLSVVDNHIYYAQNNGLFLRYGTQNATISGNTIEKVHLFHGMGSNGDGNGVGIYNISDDGLIERNIVSDVGYSGIVFNGNRTVVKNNRIENFCLVKNDGGGIYTYEGQANREFKDRIVAANIILNGRGNSDGVGALSKFFKPQVEGIYLDDNASGVEVVGNSIANVKRNGINLHNARNVRLKGNTIINAHVQLSLAHDHLGDPLKNIQVIENIFMAQGESQSLVSLSSSSADWKDRVSFSKNVYIHNGSNELAFQVRRQGDAHNTLRRSLSLEDWGRLSYTEADPTGIFLKMNVAQDKTTKINDFNAFMSAKRVECLGADCHLDFQGQAASTNQAINVVTRRAGSGIKIDVGGVDPAKEYVLRMKLSVKEGSTANLALRHKGHPWSTLSELYSVRLATTTNLIQRFFSFPDKAQEAVIILSVEDEYSDFYINEIEWSETKLETQMPRYLFLYNARQVIERIKLSGIHTDVHRNEMDEAVIPPFSSIILFPK